MRDFDSFVQRLKIGYVMIIIAWPRLSLLLRFWQEVLAHVLLFFGKFSKQLLF